MSWRRLFWAVINNALIGGLAGIIAAYAIKGAGL